MRPGRGTSSGKKASEVAYSMGWRRWTLVLSGSILLTLLLGGLVFAAKAPPQLTAAIGAVGAAKAVVPLMLTGAFFIMANAMLHLNPERTKVSVASVGTVGIVAGLIFLANLFVMMLTNFTGVASPSNLGPLTNFVGGLATMYGFFFLVVGLNQLLGLKHNVLGPIAILIAFLTLGYAWMFFAAGWYYHMTIALVWFVAMLFAGLFQVGKLSEKTLGYWLLFTAVWTFAIPGFIWASSMPGAF